ncbi:MAG TPA: AMP-binding protein [Aquabacterium sp.]|uniref:AMP-binding protein n=1 Tax=Aquabacterium sp. TaxID=1872578 RepID=UPI002E2F1B97|nr:AMP-binding protein [Aquabacterium sp.]HEX5372660.1 AMP-binding protein [Aquabacterium sp.]
MHHPHSPVVLNAWWSRLADTHERGIHVLDDTQGTLIYASYAELCHKARVMASVLAAKGIGRGDGVLLCAESRPEFPVLWLALTCLGAVPVPLPPQSALVGRDAFYNRIYPILPHFRHYLHGRHEAQEIQRAAQDAAIQLSCWAIDEVCREAQSPDLVALDPVALQDDDLAFVQYTSGSTRQPKGIRITCANLVDNLQVIGRRLALDPEVDTFMSWLPLYHDMGLIGKLLQAMLTQSSLVLLSPQAFVKHPLRFLALIESHRGSICSMPNFAYEMLLKRVQDGTPMPDLSSMRWFGVGAEPVRLSTTEAFSQRFAAHGLRHGVVSPCYGLAEATLAVSIESPLTGYQIAVHLDAPHATCGPLLDGFEARIDSEGALLIRGPSVARTALVGGQVISLLDEDGYYNTRDVADIVDGKLVILGRVDEMFVVNGENRFPYDIEAAVRSVCGETTRAACFQVPASSPSASQPEVVVLYERRVELAAQDEAMQDRIHAAVLSHAGLRVDRVVPVDFRTLPVTPSGKIQRVQARQRYMQASRGVEHDPVTA